MRHSFISWNFFKKNSKRFNLFVFSPAKFKSGAGFTLLELLVVTAIIGILTSAFLLNYKDVAQQFALQRAAYKLTQDIRKAGEMAMSAQECPAGTGCAGQIPPGYGIYLEEGDSDYILYADTNENKSYQPADDEIEPSIGLEKGVVIQDINTSNNKVSINFRPPGPEIKINNGLVNEVIITLASGGNTKTIKVNAAGLAEVE